MVAYGPTEKSASRPETLEIATMEPWSLASRCGSAALLSRTVCMRSVSNPVYQFSSVSGTAMALTMATTASMPPRRPAAASTQDVSAVPSRTSSCTPRTPAPRPASSFSVVSISPASRAQNSTVAPSSANASTMARPMPRVPPVTSTRESFSCRSMTGLPGSEQGRRAAAQLVVQAAVRRRRREEGLTGLHHGAVVGVDDVGDRHLGDLREQLVGVHRVQAVELAEPVHEFRLADPPGVLEWPARPDGHPVGVVLEPRPGGCAALHQFDDQGRRHGALDRRAAGLALTLPVVAVPDREHRPLDVDPEEAGGARAHLGSVHVAAEAVGHQGTAHLPCRRRHADRAEHRLDREVDAQVAVQRGEGDGGAGAR